MESIVCNDPMLKKDLIASRLLVGMCYLNANCLESLIEQLIQICTNPKWHARRAAVEFVQNMIFSNLFNIRPYVKRFHELVRKCLFDEQFDVRIAASTTLSGLYQCGYIPVTHEDLVKASSN